MLYREENICDGHVSLCMANLQDSIHHHTETQTEGCGKEDIAVLDSEMALAGDLADHNIDANDTGSNDTCWIDVSTRQRVMEGCGGG